MKRVISAIVLLLCVGCVSTPTGEKGYMRPLANHDSAERPAAYVLYQGSSIEYHYFTQVERRGERTLENSFCMRVSDVRLPQTMPITSERDKWVPYEPLLYQPSRVLPFPGITLKDPFEEMLEQSPAGDVLKAAPEE